MQHPMITQIERTGYPYVVEESLHSRIDFFGNEVLVGDVILVLDDEFFLKEELHEETISVLVLVGAYETTAK